MHGWQYSIGNNGTHLQRGPTVPWQCRCCTAALESSDCCTHQRRCGWEPSKAEWWMSKKLSFKTKGCYGHGDAIPRNNSIKRELTEAELKAPPGSPLWEMLRNICNMMDTRQIHTLSWNCKTRNTWQALCLCGNALATRERATKVITKSNGNIKTQEGSVQCRRQTLKEFTQHMLELPS